MICVFSTTVLEAKPSVAFHLAYFWARETPGPKPIDRHGRQWHGGAVVCGGRHFRSLLSRGLRHTVDCSAGKFR